MAEFKIGDKVFIRGYVDEIRKDTVIIRNEGGYFGTIPSEIIRDGESAESKMQLSGKGTTSDPISRQAALDAIRPLQTYKLFAGDDMLLVDKAEVQTELMMLPSVELPQLYRKEDVIKVIAENVGRMHGAPTKAMEGVAEMWLRDIPVFRLNDEVKE